MQSDCEDSIDEPAEHQFKVKTFASPTFCDRCHKLLWGLVRQGACCSRCHSNSHFRCIKNWPPCRAIIPANSSGSTPKLPPRHISASSISRSNSINLENPNDEDLAVLIAAEEEFMNNSRDESNQLKPSPSANHQRRLSSPSGSSLSSSKTKLTSMVNDILVNTSMHAARRDQQRNSEPGLNLLTTTPINTTRFIARAGYLRAIEHQVKAIMLWENKVATLLALSIYTLICLYPLLIVVGPQILIIYHLAVKYYEYNKLQQAAKTRKKRKSPKQDTSVGPKLRPQDFKENMQYIQNFMGAFSDLCDTIVLLKRQYFTWDHPENPTLLLRLVASSMLPAILIFHYVPLQYLVLSVGWAAFLGNTPLVIALRETLTPLLLDLMNENWEVAKEIVRTWPEVIKVQFKPLNDDKQVQSLKMEGSDNKDEYLVAIYENQRWWLGLGFLNYMLSSERPAWSDLSGTVPLPPRDAYSPPPHFQFLDDHWIVDHGWSLVPPCPEGWIYTNHLWGSPRTTQGVGSFTRRRKWVRRVAHIDLSSSKAPSRNSLVTLDESAHVQNANTEPQANAEPMSPSITISSPDDDKEPLLAESMKSVSSPQLPSEIADAAAPAAEPATHTSVVDETQEPLQKQSAESPADTNGAISSCNKKGYNVEYILEIDGEEVVLENVESLDQVDMVRLREMVRSLKQQGITTVPQVSNSPKSQIPSEHTSVHAPALPLRSHNDLASVSPIIPSRDCTVE